MNCAEHGMMYLGCRPTDQKDFDLMIQTYLPFPSYRESAVVLLDEDLELQRKHVLLVLETMHTVEETEIPELADTPLDKLEHVTRMWAGYEMQLAEYGLEMCEEWLVRHPVPKGQTDPIYDSIFRHLEWATSETSNMGKPPWFGDVDFHVSHQAALLRHNLRYAEHFKVDRSLDLVWPASA